MRNLYMNGAAVSPTESDPTQSPSKPGKITNGNSALKRVSSASNTGRRSESSLSVGDNNSLLSGGLGKPKKRISGSGTAEGSQLSLKLQTNLIQSVKKSLAKTKRQWDRTGFIHIIYVLVLLAYSFLGGALFMVLDGPQADRTLDSHRHRCSRERDDLWSQLTIDCSNRSFAECQNRTLDTIMVLDECFRNAPPVPFIHSTSNYWNSLIYAITVFTTIGYGNIVVLSPEGRLAMIVYAMIGIPLFFAFLNDMGQWFHFKFLKLYDCLRRKWSTGRLFTLILEIRRRRKLMPNTDPNAASTDTAKTKVKTEDDKDGHDSLIFTFAVGVLVVYLVVVCGFLMILVRQWSFFQAFYFLFQSISLIGFGDEFPENPNIVLLNITFIIIGIILLSMCFFILQEWIRGKTYRLSNQFRRSVRRWRHYRPVTHSFLDRRRMKSTRFTVPLPNLGGAGESWKRRARRIDENVAGQRLAVVDDCSPAPGRRAVVTVLTFEDEEDKEVTAVMRRPVPGRRDGVHSVDETLISGPRWSSKGTVSFADGALEAEDAIFLKPEPYTARRLRQSDRRHTVCLDEISDSAPEEGKRIPPWLKASQVRRQKQKSDKVQKRLSFADRPPARFGKFQWIRQPHHEEEDEEDEDDDGDECEIVEEDEVHEGETIIFSLPDDEKGEGSVSSDKDDEYL